MILTVRDPVSNRPADVKEANASSRGLVIEFVLGGYIQSDGEARGLAGERHRSA